MSDHEQLADEAEHTATKLEQASDHLGDHIEDAKRALQATHDDSVIPTPLGDEDETAQKDTTSEGEANAVD